MAFRFGRQPFQFDASAFQEPMQGVTYQTPSTPLPAGRIPGEMSPIAQAQIQSPAMRRFNFANEQFAEQEDSEPDKFDFGQMFKNKPTFDATQRYIDALESRPSLETYKPNMAQNIFGAIAGAGAGLRGAPGKEIYGSVERIRYGPYQRALADWEGKMQGLGSGAEAEMKKGEVDTRWMTSMGNLYNQKSLAERRGAQTDQGWAKIEDAQKAQQDKVNIARNAGMQVVKGVDGNVIAVNPREIDPDTGNPVQYDLGRDTGVEIAARRADIAQQNANTGAARSAWQQAQGAAGLNIRGQAVANQGRNIDSMIADRLFKQENPATTTTTTTGSFDQLDEQRLRNSAVTMTMYENPEYRELFDEYGNILPEVAGTDLHADFMREVGAKIAAGRKPKTKVVTKGRGPSAGNVAPTTGSVVTPPSRTNPGLKFPEPSGGVIDFRQLPR